MAYVIVCTMKNLNNYKVLGDLPARPSIKAAAAEFGLSEKTIRRWIADGRLRAYRIGPKMIRVDRESLLNLARPIGGAA
ncbi:helix-turn-helix domain-containing protein [Mycolicibacterium sp. CBM1]